MRKVVLSLFLVLASIIFFSGCDSNVFTKVMTKKEANDVFLQIINRKPLFCEPITIKGEPYIIGAYEKQGEYGKETIVSSLTRVAGNWQEVAQSLAEKDAESQELQNDFELVTIEGQKYLYFSRLLLHEGTMYNYLGFVEFLLYSPLLKQFVALEYSGVWTSKGEIKGSFLNISDFADRPQMLKFLESKAAKCKLIYRQTAQDLDINNINNFIKKWLRENPDAYAVEGKGWTLINFPCYLENLFSCADKYSGSPKEKIENQRYIISTAFNGPVLGYDIIGKTYFVIWIPEGMGSGGAWGARSYHGRFITNSMIVIKNDFHEIEIDLHRKLFRVTSNNVE